MYVYGDIMTDARVQRCAIALSKIYSVTVISASSSKVVQSVPYKNIIVGNKWQGLYSYLKSLFQTIQIVRTEKPDILYGQDYYSALLLKFFIGNSNIHKIVYDAHELIIPEKGKVLGLRMLLFYLIEKSIIKKVNIVIAASKERATLMKEHYHLDTVPHYIQNISQLRIDFNSIPANLISPLRDFFSKPGNTIVYAGVVTKSRKLKDLVKTVSNLAPRNKLLIIGNGDALDDIKSIAAENDAMVYLFTGTVPYMALGAILSHCDIGIIYYPTDTLNNINCASNKLYEYASVCLPILSNNNPTIKNYLDKFQIGIANDDFNLGLQQMDNKLKIFKKNMATFNLLNTWKSEEEKLIELIK